MAPQYTSSRANSVSRWKANRDSTSQQSGLLIRKKKTEEY